MPQPGRDFVGVGVGVMVFGAAETVFLARRGPRARNEAGTWEFPGGTVHFGERLVDAARREILEEYGLDVEVTGVLGVADHILPAEGQHWVSVSVAARHVGGVAAIREPGKCVEIGWFALDALPEPLSLASRHTLAAYEKSR